MYFYVKFAVGEMKTRRDIMKIITSLLFLSLGSIAFLSHAGEENTDWIYCVITDEYNNAAYFTEVFHGNYDLMDDYEDEFFEFVIEKYGDEVDEGVSCTFESERAATVDEFKRHITDTKDFYANVITVEFHHQ